MLQIIHHLPAGYEEEAATLYWQAFENKLGKLLGPSHKARQFFARTISPGAMLAAMEGDRLLGIAAFKAEGQGFSQASTSDLFRHYGLGALWRLVPLAMLERNAPEGVLQMDGICVSAEARGQGVGTSLLNALFEYARTQGLQGVSLDVIDQNPRAKALYEKLGFEPKSVEHTSILRPLLGFDTATRMVKPLAQ